MIEGIEITEAYPEDYEAAMELAWKTFLKFESKVYSKEGIDNFLNFISDEKLYKMFLNGDYKVYVARDKEKLVGIASVRSKNHISLLFVDSAYHRMGIGKHLLCEAQKDVERYHKTFCMTVNAAPVAIGFYEKTGFINSDSFKEKDGITYQPMEIFRRIEI